MKRKINYPLIAKIHTTTRAKDILFKMLSHYNIHKVNPLNTFII